MNPDAHDISRDDLAAQGLWPVADGRDPVTDDEAASDLRLWCEDRFGVQMNLVYLPTCSSIRRVEIEAQLKSGLNDCSCVVIARDKRVLSAASDFLTAICLAALILHSRSLNKDKKAA
jgi:hypothetical protein